MEQQPHSTNPAFALTRGEFAPVYWEPLGARGERLVVGYLLALDDAPATAHITLRHRSLLAFISQKQGKSAAGVISFAFDFFSRTLAAGGIIEDLRAPFASMSIGRIERISARTPQEAAERAAMLCTLLGEMPAQEHKDDVAHTATKTVKFLQNVRKYISSIDKQLAHLAMNTQQKYSMAGSAFRVHFQHKGRYVQFCSLPLPNARPETATECAARLTELQVIRARQPQAKVALCINIQALPSAAQHHSKSNATAVVQKKTLVMARELNIETHQYLDPVEAARYLSQIAHT